MFAEVFRRSLCPLSILHLVSSLVVACLGVCAQDYCVCLWSSRLLYGAGCLAVTSCLCDAYSFFFCEPPNTAICLWGGVQWSRKQITGHTHEMHLSSLGAAGLTSFLTCIYIFHFFLVLAHWIPSSPWASGVNIPASGDNLFFFFFFPRQHISAALSSECESIL